MIRNRRVSLAAGLVLASVWLLNALPANAGCGCDHPPPAQASIMPPFASPGTKIRVHAVAGRYRVGSSYKVDFGGSAVVNAVASRTDYLTVKVPTGVGIDPGPKKLKVQGSGYYREYAEHLFTALPSAVQIPAAGGSFVVWKYFSAVDADGTMLIPLDVDDVLDPKQLAFQITNFALAFGTDDVGIYNSDGVDLTLFTLAVEDATRRQWGEYYGWRVEQDQGIHGTVYDHKVLSNALKQQSDLLTYWRHEFFTYYLAHRADRNHFVDADGYHANGTFHVDHGRIVLAIHGGERESGKTQLKPLQKGKREIDLVVNVLPAPNPLATSAVRGEMRRAIAESVYLRERSFVERVLKPIFP